MAGWDGTGLPPSAAARMARFTADGPRTSLLAVPGAASLESVGLEPIGEVMGCIVTSIGFAGWQGCGYGYGGNTAFTGYRPYVKALNHGYHTATNRMLTEATAIGADGVVGVRFEVSRLESNTREFLALGTAVRARSRTRPARVFVTDLAGQDVAKLMHAGWVPVQVARGISVAIRHDDWRTQQQSSWGAGNLEVTGYTQLVNHVRADSRSLFGHQIQTSGADGAVVSGSSLNIWEIEPAENHRDHVAESMVFGTSLARFHVGRSAPTSSLSIMPLNRRPR